MMARTCENSDGYGGRVAPAFRQCEDGTWLCHPPEYPLLVCVLTSGPTYKISAGGKEYQFELPKFCGLCEVNRDGSDRQSPWPKVVWNAVVAWQRQGKRMDGNRCVWELKPEPDPTKGWTHVGGNNYVRDSEAE